MHMKSPLPRARSWCALFSLIVSSSSYAQSGSASTLADSAATELPAFTVSASTDRGYIGSNSLSATAVALPVIDIPLSVTVLTREVLDDAAVFKLGDLGKFVSGVIPGNRPYQDNAGSDLRGFAATMATDGFITFGETTRDSATIARVEVLKGPSAILFPQGGSAGGVINTVTKSPLAKQQGYLKLQLGEYNANRVEADVTGPAPLLNGKLLYRVIGVYQDSDGYTETDFNKRKIFAPSFTYQFSSDNQVTFKFQHWDERQSVPAGQGLNELNPAAPYFDFSLPRDRSLNDPGDFFSMKEDRIWLTLESKLSDQVRTQFGVQTSNSRAERFATRPNGNPTITANGTVARFQFDPRWKWSQYRAFSNTVSTFKLANMKHILIAGGELNNASDNIANPPNANFAPTNANNSPIAQPRAVGVVPYRPDGDTWNTKAYLMDSVKLLQDKLTLLGGYTENWYSAGSWNTTISARQYKSLRQGVKQYGANYEVLPGVHVYYSYNENFSPQFIVLGIQNSDGSYSAGQMAPPQSNKSNEFGAKLGLMNEKLTFSTAYFDTTLTNRTLPILGTSYSTLVGGGSSKGVEMDLFWQATNVLSVIGTFANISAKDNVGHFLPDVPKNTASLWTRYDFKGAFAKGLGVAGGFTYLSDMVNYSRGVQFGYAGRTVADVAVYYDWKTVQLQLNVSNLFNADYYAGGSPPAISFRGPQRNITGSVTYKF
jgi:iron complex outermembrane recepter protein